MEDNKDKVNSVLQIRLEELNSEKEAVRSYREIHFQKVTNFRGKIFTSAAVIATILIAILALKSNDLVNKTTQYQIEIIILLIIDFLIVSIAWVFFVWHLKRTRKSWFNLEYKYVSVIAHINNLRIFLATKALKNEVDADQLCNLIPYTTVSLSKYRIEIVDTIEEVKNTFIFAGDIKDILEHLSKGQKAMLHEAYKIYKKSELHLEKEKGFLVGLPQLEPRDLERLLQYKNEDYYQSCHQAYQFPCGAS
jgi:hypothetical protein